MRNIVYKKIKEGEILCTKRLKNEKYCVQKDKRVRNSVYKR